MKNLDFLPDIYRQRSAQRHARLWLVAVVLIFGAAIGATATIQAALHRNVRLQLDELQPQYLAALQQDSQLAQLNARIAEHAHEAALYTYLNHPWPCSQVLKTVVAPLPETVRLTEVRLAEHIQTQATTKEDAPTAIATTKRPPAELDLEQLHEQHAQMRITLNVVGYAQDVSALHVYVDQLSQSSLIGEAHLKSLEAVTAEGQLPQTRFEVHLMLKPGHSQAMDAESPLSTAKVAWRDSASSSASAGGATP